MWNIEGIIFVIIALYILFSVFSYSRRETLRFYEVREGSLVREKQYTGLILREEKTYTAKDSGYVHFSVSEGRRVSKGGELYFIDETGNLEKYLQEHPELLGEFTEQQVEDIRLRLQDFSRSFQNNQFTGLYNLQGSLQSTLFFNAEEGENRLQKILSQLGIKYSIVNAEEAGIISYTLDGYEDFQKDKLNYNLFQNAQTTVSYIQNGVRVEAGNPLYKIISSSQWKLLFPLAEGDVKKMENVSTVSIHFPVNAMDLQGNFSVIRGEDGKMYGEIQLDDYLDYFLDSRFVSFSMQEKEQSGLKIPVSAVVNKDFYIVPKEFMKQGPDKSSGFYRQKADGSREFLSTDIYMLDEQYCYLKIETNPSDTDIQGGNILVKESGNASFVVGPRKALEGVYDINRGYAIFHPIHIIEKNEDYLIVESHSRNGVSVYDHIVLQGDMVTDGQIIYQ